MNTWQKFLNDLSSGIYHFSAKYESPEVARNSINIRIRVLFLLYYSSLVFFLLGIYVKTFGTHKANYLFGLAVIIIYLLSYKFLIGKYIQKDTIFLTNSIEDINNQLNTYKYVLIGGVVCLALAVLFIA